MAPMWKSVPLLLFFVASATAFSVGSFQPLLAKRLPTATSPRRSTVGLSTLKSVGAQWVPLAAERQQRDPQRLLPKPMSERIVIRMVQPATEGTYADGLRGQLQKVNAGDFSDDFEKIVQLMVENGYGPLEVATMKNLDQGWRSYLMAEDTATGEIVGCCQLTRIQVGGYLFLSDDFEIRRLYVKPEYRRLGIANNLVHNLLLRLRPDQRAWGVIDRDTDPFFFLFASGFVGLTWSECGKVFPSLLWALLWPFHQKRLGNEAVVYMAAEGRGGEDAFNVAG